MSAILTRCLAYHSIDSDVYHWFRDCSVGDNIERDKKRSGTGNLRKCDRCQRIERGEVTR
ncbi:hypothetical protein KBC54_02055 [Patescibacteria group bacterium]|nr:hypothetical protein [Patescibacteria group bacterium]